MFSSVGAQDMDTSGYQMFDLDDAEHYWENGQLDVDALFRPSIDTPFCPSAFNDFEMGSMVENPIPVDEEQDKENSPPPPDPTTPPPGPQPNPSVYQKSPLWDKN